MVAAYDGDSSKRSIAGDFVDGGPEDNHVHGYHLSFVVAAALGLPAWAARRWGNAVAELDAGAEASAPVRRSGAVAKHLIDNDPMARAGG
jgi:hypothetical protein